MKLASLTFACAAFFLASPLLAQDGDLEKKKSDQQLAEELDALKRDISKGMDDVKKRLVEAALPVRKPDEIRADLEKMLDNLKKGEADQMHDGLKEALKASPEKLEKLLELNRDEAMKLLEDDMELLKKLSENADKTAELFKDLDFKEDVLKRQAKLEEDMLRLRQAQERGEKTEGKIKQVLENLQEQSRRAKPQPGSGEPKPGEQEGEEGEKEGDKPDGQKDGEKNQPQNGKEDSGGNSNGYIPNPDNIEERNPSGDTANMKLQGKDAEKAAAKDADKVRDPKYDGLKRVFDRLRKKAGK